MIAAVTIGLAAVVGAISYAVTHAADWLDARIAAHFISTNSSEADR